MREIRTIRVMAGAGPCPPAALHAMALFAIDCARRVGLALERLEQSRRRDSHSHYIFLKDGRGRRWMIRLSDHRLKHGVPKTPHFDLLTFDGTSGRGSLEFFLGEIAAGRVEWFDPLQRYQPVKNRRRA